MCGQGPWDSHCGGGHSETRGRKAWVCLSSRVPCKCWPPLLSLSCHSSLCAASPGGIEAVTGEVRQDESPPYHWAWDLGQVTCPPCASVSCSLRRPEDGALVRWVVGVSPWGSTAEPGRGFCHQDLVEEKGGGSRTGRGGGGAGPSRGSWSQRAWHPGAPGWELRRAGPILRPGNREPLSDDSGYQEWARCW